jgi:hypothetical protein
MSLQALLGGQAVAGMIAHLTSGFMGLGDALSAGKDAKAEEEQARASAALEAGRIRQRGREVMGEQAAVTAKSGLSVGAGSPLLARLDTLRKSEEDAMIARWKGDVAANTIAAQASIRKSAGYQTFLSGILGATGAGLEWGKEKEKLRQRGLQPITGTT